MALLKRAHRSAWLGCVACLSSCATSAPFGYVDLWLSQCQGDEDCAAQSVAGEHFAAQALIDPSVSRYAPDGLYTYFELARADGSLGVLELDIPTDAPGDRPLADLQASYRELSGDEVRFAATQVSGQVVLPRSLLREDEPACACDDGGFSLRFVDAGDDGELGSDDDRVRQLSFGHIGRSDSFCGGAVSMPADGGLRVSVDACAAPATAVKRDREASVDPAPASELETPILVYEEREAGSGCSSSSSDDGGGCESSASDDSGCSTHATDADASSSSSDTGCGDSGSSSGDSASADSGCEGDTSDDERSSCATARPRLRSRSRHGSPFIGTGIPLALVCLWQALRAARLRASIADRNRSAIGVILERMSPSAPWLRYAFKKGRMSLAIWK